MGEAILDKVVSTPNSHCIKKRRVYGRHYGLARHLMVSWIWHVDKTIEAWLLSYVSILPQGNISMSQCPYVVKFCY